jgi:hypothetical protein
MKLVELYEGTLFECQMIKNLLENEGIESDLNNEIIGTRGGNIFRQEGGVKVVVTDDNYDKARMIVNEFEKSRKA